MKRILATLAISAIASSSFAVLVDDDFNSGYSGWSTHGDLSGQATGGVGDSGAVNWSTNATSNRGSLHGTSLSAPAGVGNTIRVETDVQVSIDGTALGTAPSGVNAGFIGLMVSDSVNWWDGTRIGGQLARRDNGIWGVRGIEFAGWNNNDLLGLSNTGAAGTSDWFKMQLLLTDNGTTYDAVFNILDSSDTVLQTTVPGSTGIASGSTVWAGYWNAWDLGANTILTASKVDDVTVDNFEFETIPEPATMSLMALSGGVIMLIRSRRRSKIVRSRRSEIF